MIALLAPAILFMAASFSPQDGSMASRGAAAVYDAGNFDQLSHAAKQAQDINRDDDAIQLYGKALELKPEWDEGLWNLGALLYAKENYFEACTVLRRFLALHPQDGSGWALLGLSEYEVREYARALGDLRQSMLHGLGDNRKMAVTVNYVTAILLTRSEEFDESLTLLFVRAASGEATATLIEPLGLAALRLPLLPAEIPAERRKMIRMAGTAVLALQAQKYEEAEKLFGELKATYPDQPGIHFLIGVYLLGVRPDDGIKELKREIEISPSHVPARIRLAEEYIKRQDLNQGISLAQEALKLAPKDAMAHMVLGEGLVARGDSADGIRELETARDSLPDEVRARWDLFRAYTAAGRTEDASREKSEIERLSKQDAAH